MPTYLADDELDLAKLRALERRKAKRAGSPEDDWGIPGEPQPDPKILFVASSIGQGGIERHSVEMAQQLVERGMRLVYACSASSHVERKCQAAGVLTETFRLRNSGDLRGIKELMQLIERIDPDVIHVHSRRDFVPCLVAAHMIRKKGGKVKASKAPRVIVHAHLDKPLGAPAHLARRLVSGIADCVVAVSCAVKQRLVDCHGFAPGYVRVLYNGIDLSRFSGPGTKSAQQLRLQIRKELDIPADALVIGMVGRLNDKGQAELVSAAAPVLRARRGIWIVLVGPEGLRGDIDRITGIAMTEGISGRLVTTGARDDVPDVLPAFDVLVHLPETESFGLALVEAMASGLPTITAKVGGCGEIVKNGVSGFVVEQGNGIAVQAALKKLLVDDGGAALRKSMGAEGRHIAETHFSVDSQIDQLINWYRELAVR